MQQTKTYRERSHEYLAKAFEELRAGDLTQASEKGWGAASQIVKAVADDRGMIHEKHGHLFSVVHILIEETKDDSLHGLFDAANVLHRNFYEEWLTNGDVAYRLDRVRLFVDKAEQFL